MRFTNVKSFILAAVLAAPLIASAVPCQKNNCAPVVRDVEPEPALKAVIPRPHVPAPHPVVPEPHPVVPHVPKPVRPKYKEDPAAVSHDNPCGIVVARSLGKRAGGTPEDTHDWLKMFEWLKDESHIEPDKTIFYSDTIAFEDKAREFANANGYHVFHDIFTFNPDFIRAFDHDDLLSDTEGMRACSRALGAYAKNPYVFNHDGAKVGSFWLTEELPMMADAGPITKLKDDAKTLADTNGVVPNPTTNAC